MPPSSTPQGNSDSDSSPLLSLVAPAFNEEESLGPLHDRIVEVFGDETDWELTIVDDGSTDRTAEIIRELSALDPRVRGVFLAERSGQTSALAAGIREARGSLLATMDADLQNDPGDLPAMLEALEGHDAVVGYRVKRQDTFVRRASSRMANGVRNKLTGDQIRDTGCSLKLFRTDALRRLQLFEGMHRFLPTLLRYHGFDVIEHPVSHGPRLHGLSKYGIGNRLFKSLADLFAVRWMRSRIIKHKILTTSGVRGSER